MMGLSLTLEMGSSSPKFAKHNHKTLPLINCYVLSSLIRKDCLIATVNSEKQVLHIFMPPTSKKLRGHIGSALSVCAYVCACICVSVSFAYGQEGFQIGS